MKPSDARVVVIGGAAGAWGDSSFAAPQLLDSGRCDYIFFEALAEVTMGILTRAREKDASLGYATDVIGMIGRDLARFVEQRVRVVTNAGGVNPKAAAEALRTIADRAGVSTRIAWVEGDDLMGRIDEIGALGIAEVSDGSTSDCCGARRWRGRRDHRTVRGLRSCARAADSRVRLGPS